MKTLMNFHTYKKDGHINVRCSETHPSLFPHKNRNTILLDGKEVLTNGFTDIGEICQYFTARARKTAGVEYKDNGKRSFAFKVGYEILSK